MDDRPRYMISVAADLVGMHRRLDRMEHEMREAVNEVHRQYRRDLVPWRPPIDLIPKH